MIYILPATVKGFGDVGPSKWDVCFAPTGVERRCESFEETEQSGSHMVSKGTFDTYLIILASI